jgi:hypothetical protein
MSERVRHSLIILLFIFIGVFVDFLFNGILIGYIFNLVFKEQLIFIYVPLYFAVSIAISNYLRKSPWHKLHTPVIIAFLCGALGGHMALVNIHSPKIYNMDLDMQYNDQYGTVLLRSTEWPQILLVTSDRARDELVHGYNQAKQVPVILDIITDYGCNRSNAISTVAGVDVQYDNSATWAWQKDNLMMEDIGDAKVIKGPGTEDQKFFWCARPPRPAWMDKSPWRPWDRQRAPTENQNPKPAS